jgi:hypothetical protein
MIGYLTFSEMRNTVAAHVQDISTARASKINDWLNIHYFDFASRYRWPQLTRSEEAAVTLTANGPYMYLPSDVDQLYAILPVGQDGLAAPMSVEAILQQMGATSQNPSLFVNYADSGEFARRYEFLAAGELLQVAQTGYTSTSTASVAGVVGGVPGSPASAEVLENVTVSATPGVYANLPAGLTYFDITSFSVASNPSGSYLLKGLTSQVIYAVILPGDTSTRYKRVRLGNTPAANQVVTMFWKKRVKRLTQDSQTIEIPVAGALIDKTISTMYSSQREYNQAMQYHDQRAEMECEKAFTGTTIEGERVELGQPTVAGRNRKIIVVNAP